MLPSLPVDFMFMLATAAFAWGASLATYRWFANHNGWPMGEWQAHRPGLPIAIGLFAIALALLFALARGGSTVIILPLLGVLCALAWTSLTKVGAQSALLLAPFAMLALVLSWIGAALYVETPATTGLPPAPPYTIERDAGTVGTTGTTGTIGPTVPAAPTGPPGPTGPGRGIATDRQPPGFPAERR